VQASGAMSSVAGVRGVAREELPRGWSAFPREQVEASQRRRLLRAMAELSGTKGFAKVTISDLAREAGVSRKSFYELFSNKEECFAAAYRRNADVLLEAMEQSFRSHEDPVDALRAGVRTYLVVLARDPRYARAFLIETLNAGPEALAHREQVHARFLAAYQEEVARHVKLAKISEERLVALAGGLNELVHRELLKGEGGDVLALESEGVAFMEAALELR
jgi:AcrR family transcriptional regulator